MADQTTLLLDEEEKQVLDEVAPVEEADRLNAILFGQDPLDRIVAVEPGERELTLWRRMADGTVERRAEPFTPWILLTEARPLYGIEPRELEGEGFRFLYEFPTWSAFQEARFRVRD